MIKAILVEDEKPAAKRLEKLLSEIAPDIAIIQHCDSIESTVNYFKKGITPDLILLDIQLGDGLSFEIFKQVNVLCPVIFTTAYDDFAIKAFELNSIDYLLKPINKDKLLQSIEKFRKLRLQPSMPDWSAVLGLLNKETKTYKERFLIHIGEHLHLLPTSDIAYFYSIEKSTFLCSTSGKHYPLDYSLDKLEEMLSPVQFFRISRQYIVSFQAISKIVVLSKSRIKLQLSPTPTDEILVSTARTAPFKNWLDR